MIHSQFNKVLFFTLLILSPFFQNQFVKAQSITIPIEKNAMIRYVQIYPQYADYNYGNYSRIRAYFWTWGGQPHRMETLMKFDINSIPSNAEIASAKLYLFGVNHDEGQAIASENSYYLSRITSYWDEELVTWNTRPSIDVNDRKIIPSTTSYQEDDVNDITSFVRAWHKGQSVNYGLELSFVNSAHYRSVHFASGEYPDDVNKRAYVVVNYVIPPVGDNLDRPIEVGVLANGEEYTDTKNNCSVFSDNYGRDGNDIFYRFTINETNEVVLNTCGSGLDDTYLHLLEADGNLIISNDDDYYVCSESLHSRIRRTLSAGTYYAVIEGFDDGDCGDISLNIMVLPRITPALSGCEKNTLLYVNNSPFDVDINLWECSDNAGDTWRPYSYGSEALYLENLSPAINGEFLFRFSGLYKGESIVSNGGLLYIVNEPEITCDLNFTHVKELEQTIYPNKDALVWDEPSYSIKKTTNYGTTDMFRSYYWTSAGSYSHNKSFMEFDLSGLPQNAVITDAKLTLYGKNHYESQSTENSFYVSRNLGPWLENAITYSNMPDASTVEIIPMDATPDEEGAYQQNVEIPMTEWVSNWHTGIWGNFGFQLNLQNLGPYRSIHFYSSDASVATVRPKLVVRYEIPARVYCSEATTSLIVSGLNSYTWSPTTGLSCTNCSSPTITINDEVQYFVGGYGSNGCPTKYSFDVFRCDEAYAELSNAVNNEYYKVKDGCLYFKFNEEYTVGSSNNLDYSFYELNGGIKTPLNLGVKLVQKGLNYYYFNLKGQLTDGAYYLLEVSNSQKEKQYLKFKL